MLTKLFIKTAKNSAIYNAVHMYQEGNDRIELFPDVDGNYWVDSDLCRRLRERGIMENICLELEKMTQTDTIITEYDDPNDVNKKIRTTLSRGTKGKIKKTQITVNKK